MPSLITTANRPAHLHGFIRWAATATNADLKTCREPMVWERDNAKNVQRFFAYLDLVDVIDAELFSRGWAINEITGDLRVATLGTRKDHWSESVTA